MRGIFYKKIKISTHYFKFMKAIVLILLLFFISFASSAQKSDSTLTKEISDYTMSMPYQVEDNDTTFKEILSSAWESKRKWFLFDNGSTSWEKRIIFKDSILCAIRYQCHYNRFKRGKIIVQTKTQHVYYKDNKIIAYFLNSSGDLEKGDKEEDINYGCFLYINDNKILGWEMYQMLLSEEEIETLLSNSVMEKDFALQQYSLEFE
jgi:hypothetical protein